MSAANDSAVKGPSNTSVCYHCKSHDLEEVESGELVCTSCGTVISSYILRPPDIFEAEGSRFLSQQKESFPASSCKSNHVLPKTGKDRPSLGKTQCLKVIDSLSKKCNMNFDMITRAKMLLDEALLKCRRKGYPFRVLLASSCIYHVLKEHKMPFLLKDFCKSVGHSQQSFLSVYHAMCNKINLKNINYSLEDQVQIVLHNFPHETLLERQKRQEVMKKTLEIMTLAEKCWLTSGRPVMPVILASAYFAWNLLNLPKPARTFDYFYYLFSFDITKSNAEERVRELNKLFLTLASYIPHIDQTVLIKKHIIYFLKDILEYSDYLLSCHMSSSEKNGVENACDFRCLKTEAKENDAGVTTESESPVPDEDLIPDCDWNIYIRSEEEVKKLKDFLAECEESREDIE